jgi:hypothetical protein
VLKNEAKGLERLLQVSESTLKTASDILHMYHYIFIYRAILEPGLERLLQVSESTLKTASDILYMYHYIFISKYFTISMVQYIISFI